MSKRQALSERATEAGRRAVESARNVLVRLNDPVVESARKVDSAVKHAFDDAYTESIGHGFHDIFAVPPSLTRISLPSGSFTDRLRRNRRRRRRRVGAGKQSLTTQSALVRISQEEAFLPADETLLSMEVVLHKRLADIAVSKLYHTCWASPQDNDETFYGSWLKDANEKQDVVVGPWVVGQFVNEWDQEYYKQRRLVTYAYTRDPNTLGYSLGKPVVNVQQEQYYQELFVDETGDSDESTAEPDRSILSMTVTMDGEPMSDRFRIHIRGVTTRVRDAPDIALDFGVVCEFLGRREPLFANQIYDITVTETQRSMEKLFESMKQACGALEVCREDMPYHFEGDDDQEEQGICGPCLRLPCCFCPPDDSSERPSLLSSLPTSKTTVELSLD